MMAITGTEEGAMSKEEALRLIEEAAETGATELYLNGQGLSKLPPEIGQLTQLTQLHLFNNQLTELHPELVQLTKLTLIDFSLNHLSHLPPEIVQLTNLTTLYLGYNQLSHLSSQIVELTKLTMLDLRRNQLSQLPPKIVRLTNLKRFWLDDNPLISPPLEIAKQGIKAIHQYFNSLEGESRFLSEVKILLVGDGAAGKTSLTRCLIGEDFNPYEPATNGIRLKAWWLDGVEESIRLNLWDFGGQEIMHATHQFFLSRRSLYVLVLDGRRDERPEYWLRHVESFGGDSPVLIILNKQDSNPGYELNQPFLKEKYPFIRGFWHTSCSTGKGVVEFREALHKELSKVKFIVTRWANTWFEVKEKLEQIEKPYIGYDQFKGICCKAGVTEEISQDVLVEFLNDLGVVVHFKEFELEDIHVLKPKWVTEAVYKIINAPSVAERKGVLRLDDLKDILKWREGDEYRYERRDHPYFIKLMKKFELCYELDAEQVLIPDLLEVSEPSFDFPIEGALRFVLHYADFLPPSIMPRFIVKRHHEIKNGLRWRDGVVLENAVLESTAVVRADNETRRIHIAVSGAQPKVYLALIWLSLREINADFEHLKVSERVPLPDEPSITVEYDTLLNNLEQGIERFVPEGSKKACSVRDLLGAVELDSRIEGERMVEMAQAERKDGRLKRLAEEINIIAELKPNLFGVGINLNRLFDAVLGKRKN
jgi:small GTP-binding protein